MHQIWDQDHRDREVREDAVRTLDQGQKTELGDGEIYQTADQGTILTAVETAPRIIRTEISGVINAFPTPF